MKTKLDVCLLAFIFGGLGIHRFYLGQGIGVIYILFCWTGIPSFIAFIECIYFAFMDKDKFDEEYNTNYLIRQEQLRKMRQDY